MFAIFERVDSLIRLHIEFQCSAATPCCATSGDPLTDAKCDLVDTTSFYPSGFWPGGNGFQASFYAYAAPEPAGFGEAKVKPAAAFYSAEVKEFFLPYDAVRQSPSPESVLMDFCQSTYEAGADLAKWDRKALER